jgi:hypothetical protein
MKYRVSTEAVQRQYRDTDSVLSQSLPRGEWEVLRSWAFVRFLFVLGSLVFSPFKRAVNSDWRDEIHFLSSIRPFGSFFALSFLPSIFHSFCHLLVCSSFIPAFIPLSLPPCKSIDSHPSLSPSLLQTGCWNRCQENPGVEQEHHRQGFGAAIRRPLGPFNYMKKSPLEARCTSQMGAARSAILDGFRNGDCQLPNRAWAASFWERSLAVQPACGGQCMALIEATHRDFRPRPQESSGFSSTPTSTIPLPSSL